MDSVSTDSVPSNVVRPGFVSPHVFGDFLSVHPPLVKMLQQLERIAYTDLNVLMLGESGTGKDLLAQTVHRKSPRRSHPFIPINCAGIPADLLESELFGYEPGAFTGATASKVGWLVQAHRGTLFLDEIADLPPLLQPKLLRVLETRVVRPLGSTQCLPVDFRLVCATNRDLEALSRQGLFREDLYYRVRGFLLTIPPLRTRREDIPVLGECFLQRARERHGKRVLGMTPEVWCCLFACDWRGNCRELAEVVDQMVALCAKEWIAWEDLPQAYRGDGKPPTSLDAMRTSVQEALERQLLHDALVRHARNCRQVARELEMSPGRLYRKLHQYGLERPS